ncbi:hypothetical protein GCM10025873_08580 [Demequina sediminis]|nr:hypothetical protein GCM10025873_08580 [Demequina sediminis]
MGPVRMLGSERPYDLQHRAPPAWSREEGARNRTHAAAPAKARAAAKARNGLPDSSSGGE